MTTKPTLALGEFVVLMAMLTSMVALSIDTMLPVLSEIGSELGVVDANDNQAIITSLFLGFALAQVVFGPLSDSFGRKPVIYFGTGLFIVGCLMSIYAPTFEVMLAGRVLQGIGASAPRIVAVALVRDCYQGRAMAQIMSFIMAVFILVPAIAPAIGQLIVNVTDWRAIFWMFVLQAVIAIVWFYVRQPETLPQAQRLPFTAGRLYEAIRDTVTNRIAIGYTVTAGLVFGAFVGYLITSQQILQMQYALGSQFPLYFGALALAIGSASVVNARLVKGFGMRPLCYRALFGINGLSLVFLALAQMLAGHPPLWMFMAYLMPAFFCLGVLFGNFNALAMEPFGHAAGVAAAVIGSLTTLISLSLGTAIGWLYDGTILPLIAGFALLGVASLAVMWWTERGRED